MHKGVIKMQSNINYESLNRASSRGRYRSRSRRHHAPKFPIFMLIVLLILITVILSSGKIKGIRFASHGTNAAETTVLQTTAPEPPTTTADPGIKILADAEKKAQQYDYEGAMELIRSNEKVAQGAEGQAALAKYEEQKGKLVKQDIHKITHVFFHTLIMDTSKAFDGSKQATGYNQVMTTKDEFEKILQSMYDKGFVLVSLHDIAYETDDTEKGGKKMVEGNIMLPPDKKAFVLSQDDVCYYEYMDGHGFAKDLIVGTDGKPKNEMIMNDGTTSVGSYDVVPLLDDFVTKHPDFSYKGAKGVVAVTGYNGVFGYRTDQAYEGKNANIEQDRITVGKVAQCLRDDGWELASHSWGHKDYGKESLKELQTDMGKWQDRVGKLIGGTDIILYAFGADIGDWHPYKTTNEKYQYLEKVGFRYFCNVDSNQYYVQMGSNYLRQGRRNLDGLRMWEDIQNPTKSKTADLFNAADVFDKARPTPVPSY